MTQQSHNIWQWSLERKALWKEYRTRPAVTSKVMAQTPSINSFLSHSSPPDNMGSLPIPLILEVANVSVSLSASKVCRKVQVRVRRPFKDLFFPNYFLSIISLPLNCVFHSRRLFPSAGKHPQVSQVLNLLYSIVNH